MAALLGAVFLGLPFLYSSRGIDQDLGPKTSGLALLIAAFAARRLFSRFSPSSFTVPGAIVMMAFASAAWSSISSITAINPREALFETLKQSLLAALLFEACGLVARAGPARARDWTARFAVAFLLAAGAWGWIEAAERLRAGYSLETLYRITGPFGHKNLLSSLLGYALPFALFGLARFRGKWRALAAAAFLLGGGLVLLLQTRSVWLGGAVALLASAWAWPRSGKNPAQGASKRWSAVHGAGVLLLIAALGAVCLPATGMRERVRAAMDPSQNQWRMILWRKSWEMAKEHPLFGVGPGNWKIAIAEKQLDEVRRVGGEQAGEEVAMVRPHNDFLWVLCETGIPGLALYMVFFALLFVECLRRLKKEPGTEAAMYALALMAALILYLIDAGFSFPRERIAHGAFMALLPAGLISAAPKRAGPAGKGSFRAEWVSRILYLMVALGFVGIVWIRWLAEREVHLALDARATERWSEVITRLRPWVASAYPIDAFANPVLFYAGTAYILLGDSDQARGLLEAALAAHPYHAHTLNDLGVCVSNRGEPRRAMPYFERAVAVRPGLSEAWMNGAIVLYGQGERTRARDWLAHVPAAYPDPRRDRLQSLLEPSP